MKKQIFDETGPKVHDIVVRLLEKERRGRLLDAPCGLGAISIRLSEKGFDVKASDLDEKKFIPKEIDFYRTDLNESLPFDDNFFDYAVCIDGIEHLENPFHLIREFARVIKTKGHLIISTPNTLNIYHRVRFLFFGSRDIYQDAIDKKLELRGISTDKLLHHLSPIDFPYLKKALEMAGFSLEKVVSNQTILTFLGLKRWLYPFYILFLIFISLFIKIINIVFSPPPKSKELLTSDLLWGEILIIRAKKI